ncbi:MAG: tRNA uridine-5-carboxymethylaminomethyl(34) synthesis GTPase MnmE [Sphaerochaeta sp.]|nr:tRNA uridine-5-carboxymethylaminomethyl(34) synthesis GTPase MnmE [Sphaerochaeta sp.]
MQRYETDDIIYALATGWTRSALAIIRVSGNGALERVANAFSRPEALRKASNATLVHGFVQDASGDAVDEVVVAVNRAPHGYTGEDALEITCHGSVVVIGRILSVLGALGLRAAQPGEFTYRAFLHGKMDLTQAEAVEELVDAQSDVGSRMALNRLRGVLGERLGNLREKFLTVMAAIEVQLDYSEDELDAFTFPEEQLEEIATEIERISSTYQVGRLYGSGAKVVLAGRTNAGKSSLFNLLLKENRSIVSEVPGTTRDYIEEACVIDGFPVRLYDTAGLRESGDVVEREGIGRTKDLIAQADVVVYLREDGDPVPPEDGRTVVVWSKNDLQKHSGLSVSSLTGEGVPQLLAAIGAKLRQSAPRGEEDVVVQSERQHTLLDATASSIRGALELNAQKVPLDIVAALLQQGLESLGEISGAVTTEDILNKIFSGFCVGK